MSKTVTRSLLDEIHWETPVFKLSHKYRHNPLGNSLLRHLFENRPAVPSHDGPLTEQTTANPRVTTRPPSHQTISVALKGPVSDMLPTVTPVTRRTSRQPICASLKTSTENLGDHIQILAGLRLLERIGLKPRLFIDRDNEIASCQKVDLAHGDVPMLLNGWFGRNHDQWPPHKRIVPVFLGFHIRPLECPELLSAAAIQYYKKWGIHLTQVAPRRCGLVDPQTPARCTQNAPWGARRRPERRLGHEATFRAHQRSRTRHGHRRLENMVLSASLSGGRQWPTTVSCSHLSQVDTPLYKKYEPIGCRDAYTKSTLESRGVRCFESNCLSLTLSRRVANQHRQTKVVVASRDRRLLSILPSQLVPHTNVCMVSGNGRSAMQ